MQSRPQRGGFDKIEGTEAGSDAAAGRPLATEAATTATVKTTHRVEFHHGFGIRRLHREDGGNRHRQQGKQSSNNKCFHLESPLTKGMKPQSGGVFQRQGFFYAPTIAPPPHRGMDRSLPIPTGNFGPWSDRKEKPGRSRVCPMRSIKWVQSRSNSLMLVLLRVCASTFFTITAQYRLIPFFDGIDPATTTEPAGTSPYITAPVSRSTILVD